MTSFRAVTLRIFHVIFVGALAIGSAASAQENLVKNPSFESGTFVPEWSITGQGGGTGAYVKTGGAAIDSGVAPALLAGNGTQELILRTNGSSTTIVYQDIALPANSTITAQATVALVVLGPGAQTTDFYRLDIVQAIPSTLALGTTATNSPATFSTGVLQAMYQHDRSASVASQDTPVFDLSAYAGQTIRIRAVVNAQTNYTQGVLDNVRILSTPKANYTVPSLPALPVVQGVGIQPRVLDLSAGYGPTLTDCLLGNIRSALGSDAVYNGQSSSGVASLSQGGTVISFYPLQNSAVSSQTLATVLGNSNASDVVTSCGTLTIAPAVFNLTEFGALLNGLGMGASINAQGVLTLVSGDATYLTRPDYFVTKGPAGAPSLKLGSDGVYRFTDSAGNTQILRPAFIDPVGLESLGQLALALRGWTTIQSDGTALFQAVDGRQFVLTPDFFQTPPPAANASSFWWQDAPNHYVFRSNLLIPGQGFTARSK